MRLPSRIACLGRLDTRTHLLLAPHDPHAPDLTLCGQRAGAPPEDEVVVVDCVECRQARA